jgi:hypothetical protein
MLFIGKQKKPILFKITVSRDLRRSTADPKRCVFGNPKLFRIFFKILPQFGVVKIGSEPNLLQPAHTEAVFIFTWGGETLPQNTSAVVGNLTEQMRNISVR